jgi:hypothetical protein
MDPKKPQFPLKMEINYDSKEELDEFVHNGEFRILLLENSLAALKQSIRKNKSECILFDVTNLNLKVIIKKSNYKNLLNQILKHYEQIEDYPMCSEIVKLKHRL